MSVGENIRKRRKALHISAEALAEKLGVFPSTIYRYEKGDIEKVDSDKLAQIAEALHTTPAQLMGWKDPAVQDKLQSVADDVFMSPAKAGKWVMLTKWFGNMNMPEFDMWFNAIAANHPDPIERNDDDDPRS